MYKQGSGMNNTSDTLSSTSHDTSHDTINTPNRSSGHYEDVPSHYLLQSEGDSIDANVTDDEDVPSHYLLQSEGDSIDANVTDDEDEFTDEFTDENFKSLYLQYIDDMKEYNKNKSDNQLKLIRTPVAAWEDARWGGGRGMSVLRPSSVSLAPPSPL